MRKIKKFYVGSQTAPRSEWAHETLQSAINHAKSIAEENDEDQFVVQVVRVVRRRKPPITVEKI